MTNFYEFRVAALEEIASREKNRQRSKDVLARVAVSILNGVVGVSGLRAGNGGDMYFVDGMASDDKRKSSAELSRHSPSGRKLRFAIRLVVVGERSDDGSEVKELEYCCDLPISLSSTGDDGKFIVDFLSKRMEFFERSTNADVCKEIWAALQAQFIAVNG